MWELWRQCESSARVLKDSEGQTTFNGRCLIYGMVVGPQIRLFKKKSFLNKLNVLRVGKEWCDIFSVITLQKTKKGVLF